MLKSLSMDIPATWQFVKNVKRMVEDALRELPEQVRYTAGMVASELVGNAIKYGDRTELAPGLPATGPGQSVDVLVVK